MTLAYLKNVVTLDLDAAICTGCGMCANVCPHSVFAIESGKARIVARDACMECGACAQNCPVSAISVRAGVGCAAGIISGLLRGSGSACGCSEGSSCCGGPPAGED